METSSTHTMNYLLEEVKRTFATEPNSHLLDVFLALTNSAFLVTAGKVGHMEDPGRTLNLIRFIFIVHVCAAFGQLVESILTPYFHKYNSPRMAKITMKKSRRRRMSINGGRDWKICRRFLKKEKKMRKKNKNEKTWINQNLRIFSSRWEGGKKNSAFPPPIARHDSRRPSQLTAHLLTAPQ